MGKKVIDAKQDKNGNITSVKLLGNSSFTPLDAAMRMADLGKIDNAHSVRPDNGTKDYLRTNPDRKTRNNLDSMAEK